VQEQGASGATSAVTPISRRARHELKKDWTDDQAVECARRRQRHVQSDRLGSMAGSQVTAGLRGGVSSDRQRMRELSRLSQPRLEGRVHSKVKGVGEAHLWSKEAAVRTAVKRVRRRGTVRGSGKQSRNTTASSRAAP
jgi:hypothetical protein